MLCQNGPMSYSISALPDNGASAADTTATVPATDGWDQAWAWITQGGAGPYLMAISAALIGALAAYLLMRRPGKADVSKHLMYVPLLLVNAAAVYGQVAFFYESVAPPAWPVAGKLALSVLIAAAIESIAVYVGWHAHDALLQKATATAARLRRASYGLALIVGGINYAHFAADTFFEPTAASIAFGLLSMLSPWLWGLHTRRAQHVQLTSEGVVDATGATFSAERIRAYPIRSYLARRWSIDRYVTDPREAWEGYNADRDTRIKTGRITRAHMAWLVLTGRVTNPGVISPGHPDGIRALDAGDQPDPADPASPVAKGASVNGNNPGAPPLRKPAQTRAPDHGSARVRKPSNAQVKAEKLRAQNPGMAVAEIARRVGANEKTVRVWFKAGDPGGDDVKESAADPGRALIFDPPNPPVLAGVNGHRYEPGEN
jgi:hypothetical protein